MDMTEKIELIKEHKTDTLAVLSVYITHVYDMSSPFFNKDGKLKQDVIKTETDEEYIKFIKSFRYSVREFEALEAKIKKNDFNLSLLEIDRIALVFQYMEEVFKKQLQQTEWAISECKKVSDQLMETESKK